MTDRLRRVARGLGGLAALTALAGCGGDQPASDQSDSAASTTAPVDGESDDGTGGGDAGSGDGTGMGSDGTGSDTGGTGSTTTVDCATKRQELQETNFELESEIQQKQYTYDEVVTPRRGLTYLADQIEHGFDDDIMARAESIATAARESVVHVTVLDGHEHGGATGTGWFVSETEILTNAHVVKDQFTMQTAEKTRITLLDGTEFEASIAATPPETQPDMALLKADRSGTPLELGTDTDLEHGQPLLQVGHPGGVGYWVHSLGQFVTREHWLLEDSEYYDIKTTTPGLSGVSGSPLLDLEGRAVGMTWGASPPWQRAPGEPPQVAPDVVYDNPLVEIGVASHLGAESIRNYLEAWR